MHAPSTRLPQLDRIFLTDLGGCCGTDLRHVEAIAGACLEPA